MISGEGMNKKPVIAVLVNRTVDIIVKEVLAGIEEQGVIYEVFIKAPILGASDMKAYELSQLGVGIVINERDIELQVEKIPEAKPLMKVTANCNYARKLGTNAALYVKGIPLIDIKI
jgi:hypothetical protein